MQTGKIEKKEEAVGTNGKYLKLTINGQRYGVFLPQLFTNCEVGKDVDFEFELSNDGKYKNITAILPSTGKTTPAPQQKTKDDGYNRCNANNCATTMMDIYERVGFLDGRAPLDIMQIKARQVQLELAFLETGRYENIEPSKDFLAKVELKTGGA